MSRDRHLGGRWVNQGWFWVGAAAITATLGMSEVQANTSSLGRLVQVRGSVQVQTRGSSQRQSSQVGQRLRLGDLLYVPSGAMAVVQCPAGNLVVAPADGNPRGFNQLCPTLSRNVRGDYAPIFLLGAAGSGRDDRQVYLISPRQTIVRGNIPLPIRWYSPNRGTSPSRSSTNTSDAASGHVVSLHRVLWQVERVAKETRYTLPNSFPEVAASIPLQVVVEAYRDDQWLDLQVYDLPGTARQRQQTTLSWSAVANATRYIVSVRRSQPNWTVSTSATEATYPGPLPPGYYTLTVTHQQTGQMDQQQVLVEPWDDPETLTFQALQRINKLKQEAARVSLTDEEKNLAIARIYADHQMMQSAIAHLISVEPSPAISYYLGDLHRSLGLTLLAKTYYTQALNLATARQDLPTQRSLQAALRCLDNPAECRTND